MKNHLKHMLRNPVQSLLIIALIMIVTVMVAVGGNLWIATDRLSKAYEEDFITIGTVTQTPDTVQEEYPFMSKIPLHSTPLRQRWSRLEKTVFLRFIKGKG